MTIFVGKLYDIWNCYCACHLNPLDKLLYFSTNKAAPTPFETREKAKAAIMRSLKKIPGAEFQIYDDEEFKIGKDYRISNIHTSNSTREKPDDEEVKFPEPDGVKSKDMNFDEEVPF